MRSPIGAAVIGSGFIGSVHIEALRRIGVTVHGLLGSSPQRGAEHATRLGLPRAYDSLEQLLDDDRVAVVHVTSPNQAHFPQVSADPRRRQARRLRKAAGDDVGRIGASWSRLAQAAGPGRVCAVNFNIRFYPLNQHLRERSRPATWATSGLSAAATSRTGCCSTPTGTGASSARSAARCARWLTSARTGST